jgi:hypothetical protein
VRAAIAPYWTSARSQVEILVTLYEKPTFMGDLAAVLGHHTTATRSVNIIWKFTGTRTCTALPSNVFLVHTTTTDKEVQFIYVMDDHAKVGYGVFLYSGEYATYV